MRRLFLPMVAVLLLALAACAVEPAAETTTTAPNDGTVPLITVYSTPTCGCCGGWIDYMTRNGYSVQVESVNDLTPIKQRYNIPPQLQSCHTAVVDGYIIEGHVPADAIIRLLAERPDVAGITVPGMPIGAPGMEVEGTPPEAFDVLTFDSDGNTQVFASYNQ